MRMVAAIIVGLLVLGAAPALAARAPIGPERPASPNVTDGYRDVRVAMNRHDTAVVGWTRDTRVGTFAEVRWRLVGRRFGPVIRVGRGELEGLAIARAGGRAVVLYRTKNRRLHGAITSRSRELDDGVVPLTPGVTGAVRALHVEPNGAAGLAWWDLDLGAPQAGTLAIFRRPNGGAWGESRCAGLPILGLTGVDAALSRRRGLVATWMADVGGRAAGAAIRARRYAPGASTGPGCTIDWTPASPVTAVTPSGGFGEFGPPLAANGRGDIVIAPDPVFVLGPSQTDWQQADPLPGVKDVTVADHGTVDAITEAPLAGSPTRAGLFPARLDRRTASWSLSAPLARFAPSTDGAPLGERLHVQGDGRVVASWATEVGPGPAPGSVAARSRRTNRWSRTARLCNLRGELAVASGQRRSLIVCAWDVAIRGGVSAWEVLPERAATRRASVRREAATTTWSRPVALAGGPRPWASGRLYREHR
jgi:hypothetical protein